MSWQGEVGNTEIIQSDGWVADLIIYSNYSPNARALLIADSILSESLEKGNDGKNLMTKLELLNRLYYEKNTLRQVKLPMLININTGGCFLKTLGYFQS